MALRATRRPPWHGPQVLRAYLDLPAIQPHTAGEPRPASTCQLEQTRDHHGTRVEPLEGQQEQETHAHDMRQGIERFGLKPGRPRQGETAVPRKVALLNDHDGCTVKPG